MACVWLACEGLACDTRQPAPAPGTQCQAPRTWCLASDTWYSVFGTWHLAFATRHPASARDQACQAWRVAAPGRWKYSRLPQVPSVQTMVATSTTIAFHQHHLRETASETARTLDALALQPAHLHPHRPAHQPINPPPNDVSPPTRPSAACIFQPRPAQLIIVLPIQ